MMKITSLGHGRFMATNGEDTLTAEYERGKKCEDGQFHPHWNFNLNGTAWTEHIGKDEAVELARKLLVEPIQSPLSREAANALHQREESVHGVIAVELGEIIHRDLEEFLDLINDRLTVLPLCEMSYRVVGVSDDGLTLYKMNIVATSKVLNLQYWICVFGGYGPEEAYRALDNTILQQAGNDYVPVALAEFTKCFFKLR